MTEEKSIRQLLIEKDEVCLVETDGKYIALQTSMNLISIQVNYT
jgi:hypothetical protein